MTRDFPTITKRTKKKVGGVLNEQGGRPSTQQKIIIIKMWQAQLDMVSQFKVAWVLAQMRLVLGPLLSFQSCSSKSPINFFGSTGGAPINLKRCLKWNCINSKSFYKNLGLDLQAFEVENFVPSLVMIAGSLMVQSPELYF